MWIINKVQTSRKNEKYKRIMDKIKEGKKYPISMSVDIGGGGT